MFIISLTLMRLYESKDVDDWPDPGDVIKVMFYH